jgi:eukaryotic-like serine/threonine-protein kinase
MAEPRPELRAIFCEALERKTPQEQALFLDQACQGNPQLRGRVEALLRAHEEVSGFLQEPSRAASLSSPWEGDLVRGSATIAEPILEKPGTLIGPYKLLEQIGEGGFGVVFMAEQSEPVRRKVALKVLKPGMDTRQVVARFEAERQALAIMDHPNIAKVHDGGATPSGRPFFVMELVKGVPITEFCDQNHLTPRQRLELFIPVCNAVQHAHQKAIIHRDLKPSNVLVTMHDATPVIKVIDFGVAKALGHELTEKTLFTGFAQMVGTPLYMSPEQAGQSGLDIDTRSDIYSLGVLLYELLTGTTPFDRDRFKKAAYDEIRRIIREEDPPKPSTRLSESKDSLPSISAQRQTEPAKLTKLVRGELDWIVMKALEKDRNRRYETANGFAMDVQRYLADEAVLACPPSAGYRLRKFVRRNKAFLVASGVVVAALLASVVVMAISNVLISKEKALTKAAYDAEADQRRRAQARSRIAWQAADDMYTQVAEKWLAQQPQLQLVQREFLQKALEIYQEFAKEDGSDPVVRVQTAKAQARVGAIHYKLGSLEQGEKALLQAIDLFTSLSQHGPNEPKNHHELAAAFVNLANLQCDAGRRADAEQAFRRALELQAALTADFPTVPDYRRDQAQSQFYLARHLIALRRVKEADEAYGQALAIQERLVAEFPEVAEYRYHLATSYQHRMQSLITSGRGAEAEKTIGEAERLLKKLADDYPAVPEYRVELANVYSLRARLLSPMAAEEMLQQALAIQKKLTFDYPAIPNWQYDQARTLQYIGDLKQRAGKTIDAETAYRQSLAILLDLATRYPLVVYFRGRMAIVHLQHGDVAKGKGRTDEAEAAYRQAILLYEKLPDHAKGANGDAFRRAWESLGGALLLRGDHVLAGNAAAELIRFLPDDAEACQRAGAIAARAASVVHKDTKLPDDRRKQLAHDYGDQAVQYLRQAMAKGYRDVGALKKSQAFESLRQRQDFQHLLAEMERNNPPPRGKQGAAGKK